MEQLINEIPLKTGLTLCTIDALIKDEQHIYLNLTADCPICFGFFFRHG